MRLLPLTTYAKALFMDGTLPIASNTAVRKSPTNAFRISRSTFFKLMMPQVMTMTAPSTEQLGARIHLEGPTATARSLQQEYRELVPA